MDYGLLNNGHRLAIMEPTLVDSAEVDVSTHALGGWITENFGADPTTPLVTGVVFSDAVNTVFYASDEEQTFGLCELWLSVKHSHLGRS